MKNFKLITLALFAATFLFTSCEDEDTPPEITDPTDPTLVTITDDGNGTGTTTWSADSTYLIDGFVFVNDGDVLTIEPGTVVKGKAGTGADASALIIARGGKIMANGTAEDPIIFTAEVDQLDGNVPFDAKGLWGGIIILGKGELNSEPGESAIEGIPTSEPRGIYGGSDNMDNSGELTYVSIRHGGSDIGDGNEINGLTLGAVGSGTTIHHIEVIANADDGVEFFGGAPNCKNMIVSYCGDDSYDYDEGYKGYGQFWVAIQDPTEGDRLGEHDGGTDPETAMPYATPHIYNVTYVGRGSDAGTRTITFRDNAGGHYVNSIFVNQAKGIDIELLSGECTYDRFQDGNLTISDNIFYDIADGTGEGIFKVSFGSNASSNPDSTNAATDWANAFAGWNNTVTDPGMSYAGGTYDLVPSGDVSSNVAMPAAWFENVNYRGAFEPGVAHWAEGWTLISEHGLQ